MNPSRTCGRLFVLAGAAVLAGACANGTKADMTGMIRPVQPTKTADPTEPPPEHVTLPAASDAGAPASDPSNAGDDAGPTKKAAPDGGGVGSDAGTCAKTAPSNACGLAPQCGCAASQTCEVTDRSTGAVSCIAAGDGVVGAVCATTAQCGTGLTCAYGACRPYCSTVKAACSGAGLGICNQGHDASGAAVPNAKVCTLPCDLRDPSSACGANTCVWDQSINATDCDGAGMKSAREPCGSYNDCRPGLACAPHPVLGMECERWCRLNHDDDCDPLQICTDVYGADAPTQGSDKLGHCQ